MLLPTARGPLSAGVIAALLDVEAQPPVLTAVDEPARLVADPDFQLALWIALHDGEFDGVGAERAEQPEVVRWREALSERWLAALREMTAPMVRDAGGDTASPARIGDHLISLMRSSHTALYSFIESKATAIQLRELVTAKSLSEPETEIDRVPAVAIAAHNTMSVLRRGTASAIGHQTAAAGIALLFDRRLAAGLHRIGGRPAPSVAVPPEERWTRMLNESREHLSAHPGKTQDLLHAAAAAIALEACLCRHLLRSWTQATPVLEPVRTLAVIGTDAALGTQLRPDTQNLLKFG
ncbi:hypothetical protein BBK82_37555 [Lentzea guizhouensis]|uniref:Uncharacterized protein n=1 Tax=Lentzea guizhouensis TaxID=1586287 RepID=A0A1B2HSZ6_9PSEU|nr:hypothetical protein [Lentzea guizhouensis]ANZ40847.1 hypothetical protein BBK82_37555 [Lentzea guizhouensis]